MKVTFLGTGTSQGVPVIACNCQVCVSENNKDKRLRSSVLVALDKHTIIIDTGPDFRQQMLRAGVKHLDAVIYTHEHKDHTAGLDDIRAFNYFQNKAIDLFLSAHVERTIRREFAYIFEDEKYPGIPQVNMHSIRNEPFTLFEKKIIPVEVQHYRLPVLGYRIDDFCYITDAKFISEQEKEKLKGLKVLVINALRESTHPSHLTLQEALDIIEEVRPEKAYLTHLSHQMGLHDVVSTKLPSNVEIAYDGLELLL